MPHRLIERLRRLRRPKYEVPMAVREMLPKPKSQKRMLRRRKRPQQYIQFVNNGNYYRIKVPPKNKSIAQKAPAQTPPKALPKNLPPSTAKKISPPPPPDAQEYARRILKWFRENLPVLTLNFGSMCILFGFSRSDVLELRSLTMTGQLTFAIYNMAQTSILWPSVAWSMTFASVNAFKIFDVFHERTAEVNMTDEQEEIFVSHFMPHGVTPKQFERIENKATTVRLKKGDFLIKKGDILDHLFLVVEGSTHAHAEGKALVAASIRDDAKGDQLEGGDSGAWIGELAFLDRLWDYEQGLSPGNVEVPKPGRGQALYTIVADDDCIVMTWAHSDMTDLMESSKDLKSALARAMTSAVVAKVINLTVTHNSNQGMPSWSRWLSDWRRSDGSEIHIQDKLKAATGQTG